MMPGKERSFLDVPATEKQLKALWPAYQDQKPVNARILAQKFTGDDLLRMAREDKDFNILLRRIGLMVPILPKNSL